MKRLILLLITILTILIVVELTLRLFGYLPHEMREIQRDKDQERAFGLRDSQGVYLKPYQAHKKINERDFIYSHTSFGTRATFKSDSSKLPVIAMFGCSYTYGTSLDDKETYPYITDSIITNYNVLNFGTPGTGQVHDLIKIKQALRNDLKKNIKAIVVNYLSFHNERNCAGSNYVLKNLNDVYLGYKDTWKEAYMNMSDISLPFISYENNKFQMVYKKYKDLINDELPFIRQSALLNRLNNAYYNLTTKKNEIKITAYLLEEIKKICDQHHVRLFVSFLEPPEKIRNIVDYCTNKKIETIYIPLDLSDKSNYNAPIDPFHLSPKANQFIAFKLSEFLNNKTISVNPIKY